jgi:hypothetical protein
MHLRNSKYSRFRGRQVRVRCTYMSTTFTGEDRSEKDSEIARPAGLQKGAGNHYRHSTELQIDTVVPYFSGSISIPGRSYLFPHIVRTSSVRKYKMFWLYEVSVSRHF